MVLIPAAAAEANVTRATLWRYVKAGVLPAQKLGRDWVIRRADFEVWKAKRRKAGRPPKPLA